MRVSFIAQPNHRLGDLLQNELARNGVPRELTVVSAFASLPAVFRIKPSMLAVSQGGGRARLVLGVDLGGTSREVLREIASWPIQTTIVKNRLPATTFHPKIYSTRWANRALVVVGSNNLTDGGLYRNSEAATAVYYDLPADEVVLNEGQTQLDRFLNPRGSTAALLTEEYLERLLALPEIPSELQARRSRNEATASRPEQNRPSLTFGTEPVPPPPALPAELQALILAFRQQQKSSLRRGIRKAKQAPGAAPAIAPAVASIPQLDPSAFYMTLPAMRGADNPNIPGEARIPLEAVNMAEAFWGWPDNYVEKVSPRAKGGAREPRVYFNWYPTWEIRSVRGGAAVVKEVRMYLYKNSMDFRFYAGDLVRLQAARDDVVRLRG